jgi:hypothetical protein
MACAMNPIVPQIRHKGYRCFQLWRNRDRFGARGRMGLAWTPACFKERAYPASRHVRELSSEAKGTHGQASLMSQVRAVSGQPSASSILTVVEGAIEVPCRWDELPSKTQ